jgi:hypothetical protein
VLGVGGFIFLFGYLPIGLEVIAYKYDEKWLC